MAETDKGGVANGWQTPPACSAPADAPNLRHHFLLSRSSADSPQRAAPSPAGARAALPWKRSHGIPHYRNRHLDGLVGGAGKAQTLQEVLITEALLGSAHLPTHK